jgi:signal peptidase II
MIPYLLLMGIAFALDRLSKWWMVGYLAEHGETAVNAFLTLRETHNRGVALGLFQGSGTLVGWLTVAVLAGLFVYMVQLPPQQWLMRAGVAVLVGGAAGNLWDRLTVGAVLDFIEVRPLPTVFNVADILIYVGLFLLLVGTYWQVGETAVSAINEEQLPL